MLHRHSSSTQPVGCSKYLWINNLNDAARTKLRKMLRRFGWLGGRIPIPNSVHNYHCPSRYNGLQIKQMIVLVAEQNSHNVTKRRCFSIDLQTRYQEILHIQQKGVDDTGISEEAAVDSFFHEWGTRDAAGTVPNHAALQAASILDRLHSPKEQHISAVAQQLARDKTYDSAVGLVDFLGRHTIHLSVEGASKLYSKLTRLVLEGDSRRSAKTDNVFIIGLRRLMNRHGEIQLDIPACRLLTEYWREKPGRMWELVLQRHLKLGTEEIIVDVPCFLNVLKSLHASPYQAQQVLDALVQAQRKETDGWSGLAPSISSGTIASAVVHVLRNYHHQLVHMMESNDKYQWTSRKQKRYVAPPAQLFQDHLSILSGPDLGT